MTDATVHYIFDPFCGWCYGAAPLVEAARTLPGVRFSLHGGGMMAGAGRQRVTADLRNYVLHHDQRIAKLTGQPFGEAYRTGLLGDLSAVFDSEPPTTAILAAEQSGGRGLDMLKRIQRAHFIEGQKVADAAVLQNLAIDIGLAADEFRKAFASLEGEATRQHITESRSLLHQVGGQGFPTFAVVRAGRLTLLDFSRFLGRPDDWQAWLAQNLC
jgi:putative protein-disulfide isomerase